METHIKVYKETIKNLEGCYSNLLGLTNKLNSIQDLETEDDYVDEFIRVEIRVDSIRKSLLEINNQIGKLIRPNIGGSRDWG